MDSCNVTRDLDTLAFTASRALTLWTALIVEGGILVGRPDDTEKGGELLRSLYVLRDSLQVLRDEPQKEKCDHDNITEFGGYDGIDKQCLDCGKYL